MKMRDIISVCKVWDKGSKCCAAQRKVGHLVTSVVPDIWYTKYTEKIIYSLTPPLQPVLLLNS